MCCSHMCIVLVPSETTICYLTFRFSHCVPFQLKLYSVSIVGHGQYVHILGKEDTPVIE